MMPHEDYYQILGVSQQASAEEIKRTYRKLALSTHPDRNPGDPRAEERFKKISEAYAVLADPQKRSQYDQYRRFGFQQRPGAATGYGRTGGFSYSQEEIFQDLFKNGNARDVFEEIQREFQKMGFRFDENFINHLFFGGKNTFFQGFFWSGPGGVRVFRYGDMAGQKPGSARSTTAGNSRSQVRSEPPKPKGLLQTGISLLAKAGKKVGEFIMEKALGTSGANHSGNISETAANRPNAVFPDRDMNYQMSITPTQAAAGAVIEVELPHLSNGKRVSVRIPAGVRTGTRLRLKEMGQAISSASNQRGDLYITLMVQ